MARYDTSTSIPVRVCVSIRPKWLILSDDTGFALVVLAVVAASVVAWFQVRAEWRPRAAPGKRNPLDQLGLTLPIALLGTALAGFFLFSALADWVQWRGLTTIGAIFLLLAFPALLAVMTVMTFRWPPFFLVLPRLRRSGRRAPSGVEEFFSGRLPPPPASPEGLAAWRLLMTFGAVYSRFALAIWRHGVMPSNALPDPHWFPTLENLLQDVAGRQPEPAWADILEFASRFEPIAHRVACAEWPPELEPFRPNGDCLAPDETGDDLSRLVKCLDKHEDFLEERGF